MRMAFEAVVCCCTVLVVAFCGRKTILNGNRGVLVFLGGESVVEMRCSGVLLLVQVASYRPEGKKLYGLQRKIF